MRKFYLYFIESKEALNNALTNVSIVIPEKVYMYKKLYGDLPSYCIPMVDYSTCELDLIELISSKRLMT